MGSIANTTKSACVKPRQKAGSRFTTTDYIVFLIASVQFIHIDLVGVLNGTDILLMVAFLYLGIKGELRIKSPLARKLLFLGLLWLGSQCITDIVRHSTFADYARGWSNIGLTLVNFSVLCTLLYGKQRRLVIYGWGMVAAGLLRFFINPADVQVGYPWKFGLSFPVSMAVALWVSRKECKGNTPSASLLIFGILTVLSGARSAGGICLVAAIYLIMNRYLRRKTAGGAKLKGSIIVAFAVLFAVSTIAIFWFYQYAVLKGYMGEEARQKYQVQSSGKYGILLGGRTELLATVPAIIDSPILGHGSWARDPGYVIAMREALLFLGYKGALEMSPDELTDGLIPTHSFLLGAWVYAGLLGAVFWGWVWLMIVRSLLRIYPPEANLLPLMVFLGSVLIWDILFSPFGAERRAQVSYYLVMIMTYYDLAVKSAAQVAFARAKTILKPALNLGH
jgi:hypothetical protein